MKKFIILAFLPISLFAQIDSMEVNTLYVDYHSRVVKFVDSINSVNGYPRQDATTYLDYGYDSVFIRKSAD